MTYDAIVIGGGVNSLVTASYLARAGRRVVLCERRQALGGLTVTEEFYPGYRANTCVDDAGWVPPNVVRDLVLAQHGYVPTLAPVGITIPLDGAVPLVVPTNMARAVEVLRQVSPADAGRWPGFCELVARLAGFLEALYSVRAPDVHTKAPTDLLTMLSLGRRLRGLGKRGMIDLLRTIPMPISDFLDEWFEHPGLKAALAYLGVLNVQHGPFSGGTALVFLHRHVGLPVGHIGGRRMTTGGVGRLAAALVSASRAAGAELRTDAEVAEIAVENERATGVRLTSGEALNAPIVVSGTDPRRTFGTLVDPGCFDPEMLNAVENIRMRGPATRVHVALSGLPAFTTSGAAWSTDALRGGIVFSRTMQEVERAYDAAKHGGISEEPAILATLPTLDDPSLAPQGCHVLTAQVQYSAYRAKGGWTPGMREALGDAVVRAVSSVAPNFSSLVRHREVIAPPDLEERFGVTEGNLLHGELALDQFLFMRPVPECARYQTPLDGLWLCGGGTHPGAGTAGASGALAAKEILSALR
ncbi:MAG: NAD(P)/FAD-dependent oxidoreductase [Gemmatimonadaceae bacterium]